MEFIKIMCTYQPYVLRLHSVTLSFELRSIKVSGLVRGDITLVG